MGDFEIISDTAEKIRNIIEENNIDAYVNFCLKTIVIDKPNELERALKAFKIKKINGSPFTLYEDGWHIRYVTAPILFPQRG